MMDYIERRRYLIGIKELGKIIKAYVVFTCG